jgi:general L-amino acid transport system permease protein
MQRIGLGFGFDFLTNPASFDIGDRLIPFTATDWYLKAILVGWLNSLRVTVLGIILAAAVGFTVGIARLSDNWLVNTLASIYVQVLRNTPLLLQLFFWYFAVFLRFPNLERPWIFLQRVFITNKGIDIPWFLWNNSTYFSLFAIIISSIFLIVVKQKIASLFWHFFSAIAVFNLIIIIVGIDWQIPQLDKSVNLIRGGLNLSSEFSALLLGLTVYTSAFIAEVVRAGIQSVNKGQWEAARSLGLNYSLTMRSIIFPQALRFIFPPLISEFLNLAKNSSLAIAIGYNDLYAIASTISNQTGKSIEILIIIMLSYLCFNLTIAYLVKLVDLQFKFKQ